MSAHYLVFEDSDLAALERKVDERLADGVQLVGGVSVETIYRPDGEYLRSVFAQAMLRGVPALIQIHFVHTVGDYAQHAKNVNEWISDREGNVQVIRVRTIPTRNAGELVSQIEFRV